MVTRRRVRSALSAMAVCALAAACTTADPERRASPTPTSPAPATETSPSAEPVTITFAVYGPRASLAAYDDLADAFTEQQPHVTVEVERVTSAEAILDTVAGGTDVPDLFLIDQVHLPRLVEEGLVQPVDGLLEERQVDFGDGYQRSGLSAFAAAAALQCMPHDVSPLVVYYNEDLVDLAAVGEDIDVVPNPLDGWSWEEFDEAAREASRGPANGVYIEPSLESLAPFVWSAGGEIVDDLQSPTRLTLSEGDSLAALEQVLALVRDPQVTPTSEALERKGPVARFRSGQLGMILGTRALTPVLRSAADLRFDVMPLPRLARFRTISDMTGYCISANTEHVEAAADLLAFAVSREGATITTSPGYVVPSNLEVANSSVFAQQSQQPESAFIFNEGVRRSQPLPFVPEWVELAQSVEPELERMFYAPVIDLESMLVEIDAESMEILGPREQ